MYKRLRKNISNNNDSATIINQDIKNLTKSLEKNISLFEGIFSNDQMLIVRRFQNEYLDAAKCCVLYFDGMINPDIIKESIIQPILQVIIPVLIWLAAEIKAKKMREQQAQ